MAAEVRAGSGEVQRRLAAIMFTDVVGCTALTERDETRAIGVRDRHRERVRSLATQFQGSVVETPGDEALVRFPSALLAVDCALAIQAALRDDPDLALRIGIHVGDIVERDGEAIGEGVNLAARIRPLADPGGVCVSSAVYDLVRNHPHIAGRSLGSHALKNVSQPMEVFALEPQLSGGLRPLQSRKLAGALIGGVAALALGYGLYASNRAAVLSWIALNAPRIFSSPIEQQIGFATTSDEVRIAYATTGEGPPLFFVLGWASHLERGMGSPLYDRGGMIEWNSRNHLFVRYDGRGFGLSDRDVDDFSLDARVRDLEAVVDAIGAEKVSLLAVSAGGPTAIAYAVRAPERVSNLILLNTMLGTADMTAERREQWLGMTALFRTSWDSPVVRSMMVAFLAPEADEVTQRVVSEFLRISGDGPAVAGFLEELLEIDTRPLATQIEARTLVIHASGDAAVPVSAGRDLAATIPGARFEIIEGGHMPEAASEAGRVRELTAAFLAEAR